MVRNVTEKVESKDRIIVEITFPLTVSVKERLRIIASIENILTKEASDGSVEIGP